MKDYSVFDILGPIMVGPSSSHTAGACRLGRIARVIAGDDVRAATFYLHGSFARTYRGHGTDRALLAGVLGMNPDDERLPDAFRIADELGVSYAFEPVDLGDVHPNTVRIAITGSNGRQTLVTGASVGGGSVLITGIDGMQAEFSGDYHTLITTHNDRPGIIAGVTNALAAYEVNIAFMRVFRAARGENAIMVIESDQQIPQEITTYLMRMPGVEHALVVPAIKGGVPA